MKDCIISPYSPTRGGYAQRRVKGKLFYHHRLAYEEANGPVPEGMIVMHTCDNPPCINPDHLRAGTQGENIADRDAKGRQSRKLGDKERAMVADFRKAGMFQREIAEIFNVRRSTIGHICRSLGV